MQVKVNTKVRPGATPPYRNLTAWAGRWSARHRKSAIIGWFAFVAVAMLIGGAAGLQKMSEVDQYSGETKRAEQAIIDAGLSPPNTETVMVKDDRYKLGDRQFDAAVIDVERRVAATKLARNITSPLHGNGIAAADGHAVLVQFEVPGRDEDLGDNVSPVVAAVDSSREANPHVDVEQFGIGSVQVALEELFAQELGKARNVSLPVTLVILLIAFGSIIAAGIPVLLAITAVMATIGLVALPSQLIPVDEAIAEVILLIGMAVGVDYSLFYLKRQREERAAGRDNEAAIEAAAATSGRAVLVSGVTVMAAMAGMFLTGATTFMSFAIGTMMVVAVAMAGSLTVLPAILSLLGDRVEKGSLPLIGRRRRARQATGDAGRFWTTLTALVMRRPVVSAIAAAGLLIVMAIPAFSLSTEVPGISTMPKQLEPVKAYGEIQREFPSENLPATVVFEAPDVRSAKAQGAIRAFGEIVASTNGLQAPHKVEYSRDRRTVVIDVPVTESSDRAKSEAAVTRLREELIPSTLGQVAGSKTSVSGMAASSMDFNTMMAGRAPLVVAFVLVLALLLLLVVFRSVVIPVKAVLLNLLSVGAAYGVLVKVFQDGWGDSLLGFEATGAISSWVPMFLFVILFGLSMDYHVFILSRIREAVDSGMSNDDAVAHGLRSTAGVVTSAAIVMVAVFAIFATLSFLPMKQMGVGLATAILIDATIVRAVLLPATMKLLGEWNWYLPRSLRWLPKVSLDGKGALEGARA